MKGPWSTDRAAHILLLQTEKLKVTTPYERHFLLLCMTSTVLVKIRAILDDFFSDISDKDRIYKYSSPKILRVIEILKCFVPEKVDSNSGAHSDEEKEKDDWQSNDQNYEYYENCDCDKLEMSRKCFNCDCDLMTQFLVKRLNLQNDFTYDKFVELKHSSKNKEKDLIVNEKKCSSNSNISNCVKCYVKNNTEQDFLSKKVENSHSNICQKVSQLVKSNDTSQQKEKRKYQQNRNCQLPLGHRQISNNSPKSGGQKINEVSTIENYLQYHEYLLLPKFKVDRHSHYDHFNSSNPLKVDGHDDLLFKQMKSYGDSDVQLCGLIFVDKKFTAKVLFHVLNVSII